MAEGLLRPPSSLSLLLMERANLANETRALKRPLVRGTNREESVYVQRGPTVQFLVHRAALSATLHIGHTEGPP